MYKLQSYDLNLLAYNNGNMNSNMPNMDSYDGIKSNRKQQDANSEINYGNNNIEKQRNQLNDVESHNNNNFEDGRSELQSISQHGQKQNNLVLNQAPLKKAKLDPINQESTMNEFDQYFDQPKTLEQTKSNLNQKSMMQLVPMQIINDDIDKTLDFETKGEDQFEDYLPQNMSINQSVQKQVTDPLGDEVNDADTAVLYIFATLKQGFGMRQNQVGGILADKNKYLVQMCVKGSKGGDYQKVLKWYNIIYNTIGRLIFLLQNELDQVTPSLNVIKSGLFSKDPDVANMCARVFSKLASLINENQQSAPMNEFKHSFWEWLTVNKNIKVKKNAELESFQNESGIKAFVRAQVRHPVDFLDQFALFLIQAGEGNQIELFTHHLQQNCSNNLSYLNLMHDMFDVLSKTQSGRIAFIESGVINVLIDMALQIAGNANLVKDSGFSGYNGNAQMLSERTTSMIFLVDIWKQRTDFIQSRANESRMADAIISTLKRGCRDGSKAVAILSMNLLASLLDQFSKDRNKFAPIILKALTFILIELYLQNDLREEMLHNFISLFKSQPQIPIQIVCEPLFKQIQINLEKQDFIMVNSNILQPQRDNFDLNSTDFLFFMNIAVHQKLTPGIAIQLLSIVIEISRKNLIYTRISLKLLLTVLNRFENNTAVFEFCQKEIKNNLNILFKQDQQKVEIYKELMRNPKNQIQAKKRAKELSLNGSLELGLQGFSNIIGKNSHNIKYKHNEYQGLSSPSKSKGIVISSSEKLLDDSDLQNLLNPSINQEESSAYLNLRTNEKMIINQLQCLTNTGIKVLVDFIRDQLLDSYIKIEKKFKFKNKGIIYLLQIFNQDVTKMLQFYHTEQQKERAEQARMRKLQKEQDLAVTRDHTSEDEVFPLPVLKENFSAMNKYNDSINEREPMFNEPYTSLTVKKSALKSKKLSREESDLYGTQDSRAVDFSYEQTKRSPKRQRNKSMQSMESIRGARRNLGERVGPIKALEVGKSKMTVQIELYDPADYEGEGQKYISWIKKYLKLYKAMFHKYSNISKNKNGLKKNTFDSLREDQKIMNLFETFSFLNDFSIMQNFPEIKRDDVKNLISYSNLKRSQVNRGNTEIDLEGFIELILQIAYIVSERLDKASVFLPRFFRYLKSIAMSSDLPLFQRLFEDPQASSIGDPQVIKELTRKVNLDPNYKLPPGFVRYPVEDMIENYKPPEFLAESQQVSLMIIDDIFLGIFGDHYLQPDVNYKQRWGVKPDVFKQNIKQKLKPQYMTIDKKHTYGGRNASYDMDAPTSTKSKKLNNDIRYSSQPRSQFAKKMSIRKKPVMQMESTLEPEIDISLKVILAENLLHPNRNELKESAFIMNDMLNAIDSGETQLDPMIRNKYYQTDKKPKQNQIQLHKEMKAMEDHVNEQHNQRTRLLRDAKLKKELEFFHSQKQIKAKQKQIEERNKMQQQADEQKKQQEKKKAYYDQLKVEFVEKRLPTLQETSQIDSQLKQMTKAKQKHEKQQAGIRIEKQAHELSKKFMDDQKQREKAQQLKQLKEQQFKRKHDRKNQELAGTYNAKESLRASATIPAKNLSLSPMNKNNARSSLNAQKTYQQPLTAKKSTTKSVQQLPPINRQIKATEKSVQQLTDGQKKERIEQLKREFKQKGMKVPAGEQPRQASIQPQRNAQIRR